MLIHPLVLLFGRIEEEGQNAALNHSVAPCRTTSRHNSTKQQATSPQTKALHNRLHSPSTLCVLLLFFFRVPLFIALHCHVTWFLISKARHTVRVQFPTEIVLCVHGKAAAIFAIY